VSGSRKRAKSHDHKRAEFARQLEPKRPGRIINITSGQGHRPMPGHIAYVVTKAALDALTLTLSAELAGRATVNAIDPGPTDTGWISDELRSEILQASPETGISSPEEIARLVRQLSGDAAASMTGQVIRAQLYGRSFGAT
jgi:3-oxoacyl-[acyl-carrier protein] reductase